MLTGPQLVKKFPAFYGTRNFITAFTRAGHLSLSCARLIQPMPPSHFLEIHFNIILPCTTRSSKWSRQASPPKPCVHLCFLPYGLHGPLISFFLILSLEWLFCEEYRTAISCHLVPRRPKYPPQHPIFKHSQPVFLPQWKRSSFTPVQKHRQNHSSVYVNIHIFG
jgi:hypothetical protein